VATSVLPPKADIGERDWHVRYVPKADILRLEDGDQNLDRHDCVRLISIGSF